MSSTTIRSKDTLGIYGQVSQSEDESEPELSSSLVAPDPQDVGKPTAAVPMMEIIAPATLMEGYQLDTQVGDQVVTVTIPPGGVEKGQTFTVKLPPATNLTPQRMSVPVGHWKNGLFDCFEYGLCHASVCTSLWCHALAAGQVITRLQLNWLGVTTNSASDRASAFTTLFSITFAYLFVKVVIFCVIANDTHVYPPDWLLVLAGFGDLVNYAYFFLSVVVIRNVRSYVRNKYAIPEQEGCPMGWEDVCCSFWCPCLTAAQLQRHTAEYETYRAELFSETGLPAHVPALIV